MRLLSVHNRYRTRGGEDAVFEAEAELLERGGHRVERLVFDNRDIPESLTPGAGARLALGTLWSREATARLGMAVRRSGAEVVHVHNAFPLVSPAAFAACREGGAATVQTLHNYRLLCPAATLFRAGAPCGDCLGRRVPWPGVVHACYRGSRPQTAVVAAMLAGHRARRTWQTDVDLFVALSEFARRELAAGGLPPDRLVVKPNHVGVDVSPRSGPGEGFLFAGRLVEEKGVRYLLRAWEGAGPAPLRIAGDGPLAPEVEAAARSRPDIAYLGLLSRADVLEEMRGARALVFPSLWYEACPVTILEAFACGLPVIAPRLGAMAELVEDGRTGLFVAPGDPADLAAKVAWARDHPADLAAMGRAARRVYERDHAAPRHLERLLAVYALAVERFRARVSPRPRRRAL